jgi:hypothetical protein
MEQRRNRSDAAFEQSVHEAVVEGQSDRRRFAMAVRDHPRPREGEPVRVDVQPCQSIEVLLESMDVVARRFAGRAVLDLAGQFREVVPGAAAAARDIAFYLP